MERSSHIYANDWKPHMESHGSVQQILNKYENKHGIDITKPDSYKRDAVNSKRKRVTSTNIQYALPQHESNIQWKRYIIDAVPTMVPTPIAIHSLSGRKTADMIHPDHDDESWCTRVMSKLVQNRFIVRLNYTTSKWGPKSHSSVTGLEAQIREIAKALRS